MKIHYLFTNISASFPALDINNSLSAARMCSSNRVLRPTALSASIRPLLLAIFSRLAVSSCEMYFRVRVFNTSARFTKIGLFSLVLYCQYQKSRARSLHHPRKRYPCTRHFFRSAAPAFTTLTASHIIIVYQTVRENTGLFLVLLCWCFHIAKPLQQQR